MWAHLPVRRLARAVHPEEFPLAIQPIRLFGDPVLRKAAMKEIRESEWFGLERPTVKISPHPTGGLSL